MKKTKKVVSNLLLVVWTFSIASVQADGSLCSTAMKQAGHQCARAEGCGGSCCCCPTIDPSLSSEAKRTCPCKTLPSSGNVDKDYVLPTVRVQVDSPMTAWVAAYPPFLALIGSEPLSRLPRSLRLHTLNSNSPPPLRAPPISIL